MTNSVLTLDLKHVRDFVSDDAYAALSPRLRAAAEKLYSRTGAGSEMTGWVDLPVRYPQDQLELIREYATRIREQAQVLVVIGIGGSHLGGEAGLHFLRGTRYNQLTKTTPEIYFVGNNLSGEAHQQVRDIIGERDFAINVISKSGTTLEPALGFAFWQQEVQARYGAVATERIYVTTDAATGLMKRVADERGYATLVVPDDVGGRYSGLTPVGMLPWAVAGVEVEEILAGARQARAELIAADETHPTWQYAGYRYLLGQDRWRVETLATYEPRLSLFGRWWQQLFAESEGKNERGVFPTVLDFTQDLHSVGQYLQQGQKFIYETTLWLDEPPVQLPLVVDEASAGQWPELTGKTFDEVNRTAMIATTAAHAVDGGVPNFVFHLRDASAFTWGYTLYFFETSCALSAYLWDVNPFDQPGVAAYKNRLTALLREGK